MDQKNINQIPRNRNHMKKPKNYYCHRQVAINNSKLVDNGLQIVEKIGEGSFGEVYKVFDPQTSSLVVLKIIKNQSTLTEESKILSQITKSDSFDRLRLTDSLSREINQKQNQRGIMMACLGPSTGLIMKKIKKMGIYSMKKIAYQVIQKLSEIHKHYVHRDIKPDNILLGNKYDCHSIYLIDFGLASVYKKQTVKVRKIFDSVIGTAKYCPIVSHLGLEQHPKDDLESLGYVLLYYVNGELPWEDLRAENDELLFQKISKKKQACTVQDLCGGVNCLRKYWDKLKGYKVGDKINYKELMQIFDVGDPKKQRCFEFCNDCWIRQSIAQKILKDDEVFSQPKASKIRASILS